MSLSKFISKYSNQLGLTATDHLHTYGSVFHPAFVVIAFYQHGNIKHFWYDRAKETLICELNDIPSDYHRIGSPRYKMACINKAIHKLSNLEAVYDEMFGELHLEVQVNISKRIRRLKDIAADHEEAAYPFPQV